MKTVGQRIRSSPFFAELRKVAVRAVLSYFRLLARTAVALAKPTIIGIAGSVGKSSTRNAVAAVLSPYAPTRVVSGNSETGVPLGLLGLSPIDYSPLDWLRLVVVSPLQVLSLARYAYVIVEMGIDEPEAPKNMEYLLTIIKPHIGIVTEESLAHSQQFARAVSDRSFRSEKDKLSAIVEKITQEDAKMVLQADCHTAICNADTPVIRSAVMEPLAASNKRLLTFGLNPSNTVSYRGYDVDLTRTVFRFSLRTTAGPTDVSLAFRGYALPKETRGTLSAAILTGYALGIPLARVTRSLEMHFHPPKGRSSLLTGKKQTVIIDSSYNASKPAVLSLFDLTRTLREQTGRYTIVILADMLELGPAERSEHEAVAKAALPVGDSLYLVGSLTKRYILPYCMKKKTDNQTVRWFAVHEELAEAVSRIPPKSLVLVKGSQGNLWLEEVIKPLLADKADYRKLCRQDAFWRKVKKKAGRWVS